MEGYSHLCSICGSLLVSQWVMKKPLIQRMLGKELTLPQPVWSKLNLAWAVFFILCGLANIYIAFWLPQNIWVNFKVFGLTALTLIFTLLSGIYIYRHMPQEDKILTRLPVLRGWRCISSVLLRKIIVASRL